jgi:hypothetical protein
MINNLLEIIIWTVIFVLALEYGKFYNETKSPYFFLIRRISLPLLFYIFLREGMAIILIFIIDHFYPFSEYEYPLNVISISVSSSTAASLLITSADFHASDMEMNLIRKFFNDFKINIINDIKNYHLEKILIIDQLITLGLHKLKKECIKLYQEDYPSLELNYRDFEEEIQTSLFAKAILEKNVEYAKFLVGDASLMRQ